MDTELMDTEVRLDQQLAPSGAIARFAEEFSGHDNVATIGQFLDAPLDDHAKSSDAITDAPSLTEGFAGIVYFAAMAADGQGEGQSTSTHQRTARSLSGAETADAGAMRGGRTPTRPWRLRAATGNPKN